MPSPLVHGSLIFVAKPLLSNAGAAGLSPARRFLFFLSVLGALLIPDVDFLFPLLYSRDTPVEHGTVTHSFLAGIVFAFLFAPFCKLIVKDALSFRQLWIAGLACYLSHVLLDACTFGRGVTLLWPFYDERLVLPTPLFTGLRWSDPGDWRSHLVTLATELTFVWAIWFAGWRLTQRNRPQTNAPPDSPQSTTGEAA